MRSLLLITLFPSIRFFKQNLFQINRRISYSQLLMLVSFIGALLSANSSVVAQGLNALDRDHAREMLRAVKEDLKKYYYDPTLRGIDIEARFKAAEERLKQANTRDQLMIAVAQTMLDFDDSHTFFVPPGRAARVEYGWEMRVVGDKTFVTAVKPKSDADAKGVKAGDEIVSLDGFKPSRENLWKMYYRYYALMPARSIRLVLLSPGESQPREIEVMSKIQKTSIAVTWSDIFVRYLAEGRDVETDRYVEIGNDLFIWEMTSFETSQSHVESMMRKAQKFKTLVLDLRGNPGGYSSIAERLVGYFFDREIKIGDEKGRKASKPIIAKPRDTQFKGELIVLIDSDSASAAEVFARVIQLEKRGKILGDRSAGAVMMAKHYSHQTGVELVLYFGTSVTIADLIMTDGKGLENVGVAPDEAVVPTGADMAAARDITLARAAEIAGVKLEPEKAGTFFPRKWRN